MEREISTAKNKRKDKGEDKGGNTAAVALGEMER